jgi:hypothetical protein
VLTLIYIVGGLLVIKHLSFVARRISPQQAKV